MTLKENLTYSSVPRKVEQLVLEVFPECDVCLKVYGSIRSGLGSLTRCVPGSIFVYI